jgi:hypothetical protein
MKTIAMLRKVRHRGIFKVGMGVYIRGCGLQPRSHAESGEAGRSVRVRPEPNCVGTAWNHAFKPSLKLLQSLKSPKVKSRTNS